MKIQGKVTLTEDDLRELIRGDVFRRIGIVPKPEQVWLGVVRAGEPSVEAVVHFTDPGGVDMGKADG